jgi:hypothetical protein
MKLARPIILLLLLSACTLDTSTSPENIRQGTEGITISFLQTLPKEIVVTGTTMERISFLVELRNKGAYPEKASPEGSLWLSGFDPKIISMDAETTEPFTSSAGGRLEGRTGANAVGGLSTHEFQATINSNALPEGKYTPTILANVCYRYKTIANPVVCIEKDPFLLSTQKKACSTADTSLSSQGAPVAVTKVETVSTTDNVQFKITVRNLGKGNVVNPALSCSPPSIRNVQRHELDILSIESVTLGGQEAACSAPDKKVRLIDGLGFFTCTIEKAIFEQQQAAFSTPLDITLSYLYKDSIEQPLVITKI